MPPDPTDPFEARGLESLYRERDRWMWPYAGIDHPYRRQVVEAIERLEHYGRQRRVKDVRRAAVDAT